MRKVIILCLALGACAQLQTLQSAFIAVNTGAAVTDQFLRDRCGYAIDAARIFRVAAKSDLANVTDAVVTDYCKGERVTNFSEAMETLQRLITVARAYAK